jgi:hypothetical protein
MSFKHLSRHNSGPYVSVFTVAYLKVQVARIMVSSAHPEPTHLYNSPLLRGDLFPEGRHQLGRFPPEVLDASAHAVSRERVMVESRAENPWRLAGQLAGYPQTQRSPTPRPRHLSAEQHPKPAALRARRFAGLGGFKGLGQWVGWFEAGHYLGFSASRFWLADLVGYLP